MTLPAFLQGTSSIASVLPTPTYGLMALWQARSALQSATSAGAAEAAKAAARGIDFLDRKDGVPDYTARQQSSPELRAALTALLASAQKRLKSEGALQTFETADAAFVPLLAEQRASLTPFLGDYLKMLVDFGVYGKADDVARILNKAASALKRRAKDGAPFIWLRAAMYSPSPRMALELAASLAAQNDSNIAFEAFMYAAGLALGSNEQEVASEAIDSALSIFPENGDARRVRGLLHWRSGDFEKAKKNFTAALEINPTNLELRVALAHAFLKLKDTKQALVQLSLVLAKDPDNLDALSLQGEVRICIGEEQRARGEDAKARSSWQEAVESLSKTILQRTECATSRRLRAIALYHLGKLEDALVDLDEALKLNSNDLDVHGWRVAILLDLGRHNEALSAVNVAFALIQDDPPQSGKKAWLLGMKGLALLQADGPEAAIQTLLEASNMEPSNEAIADYLVRAHKDQKDSEGLVECVRRLQSKPYSTNFLLHLYKEEIRALRRLEDYEAAFDAMTKALSCCLPDPDLVWLQARLLADIGDFEAARDVLGAVHEGHPSTHHLSLNGWVIQNLESRGLKHRTELGRLGCRQYEAALKLSEGCSNGSDVWLRKGLANAMLRASSKREAFAIYKQVIKECEQRIPAANSLAFALIAWCYHCTEDHTLALRYYAAALDRGEPSVAVEFDSALALSAARSSPIATGHSPLDRYWQAIISGRGENILRRVGFLRVALKDIVELEFRAPDLTQSPEIKQLLCTELRDAIHKAGATADLTNPTIVEYLSRVRAGLVGEPTPSHQEAFNFRIEAHLLLRQAKASEALPKLQKAARVYSRLKDSIWAALTWRDLASAYISLGYNQTAYEAASMALKHGLYSLDLDSSCIFIALATRRAALTEISIPAYESLIRSIFVSAGPGCAYVDGGKLIAAMSPPEHKLFAVTVQKLFPRTDVDDDWMYGDGWKVPNIDNIVAPFLPYFHVEPFAKNKRKAQSLTVAESW